MSRRKKPVLIVQHAPHEHPAAVRRALEAQQIQTLWIHPYRGQPYPKATEISGIVSLGGPMGANDENEHPWIRDEIKLMAATMKRKLPLVGICLGGQMLARAMGGRVEKSEGVELGWFPVELNEAGLADPVVGAAGPSPTVYHWHGDTFHLPPGAVLLGRSQACARQAYRIGDRAYGFQFHPEADHQLVLEWLSLKGVEEEIAEVQRDYGAQTVQDSATQRNHALKGEKASLKITAAISSLFEDVPYEPVSQEVRDNFDALLAQRSTIVIEFEDSRGNPIHLKGHIAAFLTVASGEYVIFQEETMILWPVRADLITGIGL